MRGNMSERRRRPTQGVPQTTTNKGHRNTSKHRRSITNTSPFTSVPNKGLTPMGMNSSRGGARNKSSESNRLSQKSMAIDYSEQKIVFEKHLNLPHRLGKKKSFVTGADDQSKA